MGLQADLIRVLENLPQTASSQVHDLGERPQGSGNQRPGFLLGSHNLVVPPSPSHSSSTGEGLTAADHGNSDLSRVNRGNVVASAGQTEDRIGSNPSASSSGLPQVWQGEQRGAPQLGSTLHFSDQQDRHLESSGEDPEVLNEQDLAFLVNHIRKGTKGTYKSGILMSLLNLFTSVLVSSLCILKT